MCRLCPKCQPCNFQSGSFDSLNEQALCSAKNKDWNMEITVLGGLTGSLRITG